MADLGYEYALLNGRLLRRHAMAVGNGTAWLVQRMVPDAETALAVWDYVSTRDEAGLDELLREPDLWSGSNRDVERRTSQLRFAFGTRRACDCSDCIDERRAIMRDAGLVASVPSGNPPGVPCGGAK